MNRSILVLTCLFNLATQAQRTTSPINQDMRNADETRREQRREALERNKIVVRYEKDSRGQYLFYCENKSFCNYTVTVSFSELENLQSDVTLPATFEVPPSAGQYIFTLRKTGGPVTLRYSFRYTKGCNRVRPDTGFAYLLPISPGKETRVFELSYLGAKYAGDSKPKDYYVLGIHMHSGDTIFAARRGRVTEVSDDANLTDSGYTFAREDNYVEIVHDDCSFGKYIVFRDSSIFVQPGDWVEAGQPLGIVGGERYAEGPHVRFSVRYHLEQPILDKDGHPTERTEYWAYVPVNFWVKDKGKIHLTKGTTYTSELSAELVTKEMSKKAARKWKEAHPMATP